MRAAIFLHLEGDSSGLLGKALEQAGIICDDIHLYKGEPTPDPGAHDILVTMGAAQQVWETEEHPWLVRAPHERRIPLRRALLVQRSLRKSFPFFLADFLAPLRHQFAVPPTSARVPQFGNVLPMLHLAVVLMWRCLCRTCSAWST